MDQVETKPIGLLLGSEPGRGAAFAIITAPLVLIVLLLALTSGGGPNPYDYPGYGGSGGAPPALFPPQSTEPPTFDQPTTYDPPTYDPPSTAEPPSTYDLPSTSDPPSTAPTDPAGVVQAAYDAVNRGDYQTAYDLGLGRKGSYDDFVAGEQTTSHVEVSVGAVAGAVATVTITAEQTDGTTRTFTGTYTVTGGVITDSHIE